MNYYGKAEETARAIVTAFETGTVPKALRLMFLKMPAGTDVPCRSWSWNNQMIAALFGHDDARGFRQWEQVGRHVRKGEKAFYILVPLIKKTEEQDDTTGEKTTGTRIYGFKGAPVFGYDQTDGDTLPGHEEAQRFVDSLPLANVAKAWGLHLGTYQGGEGKPLGYYRHGKGIALAVENLTTWTHELIHAAEDRLGKLKEKGEKRWMVETVAELGAAVLAEMIGRPDESDRGGAYRYIASYVKSAGKEDVAAACMQVINRVCDAVALILKTADELAATEQQHDDQPAAV